MKVRVTIGRKLLVVLLLVTLLLSPVLSILADYPGGWSNDPEYRTESAGEELPEPLPPGVVGRVGEPITITEMSNGIRLNFSMFTYEFYNGTEGYNVIFDHNGDVVVHEERQVLQYWAGSRWKQRGEPFDLTWIQVDDYQYNVTRHYRDYEGTFYNVTFIVRSDAKVKSVISIDSGQTDEYRLLWQLTGIAHEDWVKQDNQLVFGDREEDWIGFDWNDVFQSLGDVTETSVEITTQGRKASIYFNIDVINAGQTVVLDPSTVATSTHYSAVQYGYQRAGFYAAGLFWAFYSDGDNAVYEHSHDGTTWAEGATSIGGVSTGYGRSFGVWFDGTYVHYVRIDGFDMFYRRGTPVSDGTITWSAVEQTVYDGTSTSDRYLYPCIAVDTNGYAWIGVYYDAGDPETPYVLKNDYNNGSWTTDFAYQLNAADWGVTTRVCPVPLNNGKVYVIYARDSNPPLGELYDAGWGGEESDLADYSIQGGEYFSVVALGDNVHFVYNRDVTYQIRHNERVWDVGWNANDVLVQDGVSSITGPVLSADPSSGTLYCFWTRVTTDHVYYKKYDAGWDADPTDWIDESTDDIQYDDLISSFYMDYGDYIGLLYVTRLASPYNVRFEYFYLPTDTYTWTFKSTTTTTSATTTSSVTDTDTITTTPTITSISTTRTTSTTTASDNLWVNSYDGDKPGWDVDPPSPYLNDNSDNWIYAKAADLWSGDYGFEDMSDGAITDVDIFFECWAEDGPGNDGFEVTIWNGIDWIYAGLIQPGAAYAYESIDISAILDTATKVNGAELYVTYDKVGGVDEIYIRRCYINVDHSPLTTVTSCTTSSSTSCETITSTQYTSSCATTELVMIWTVVQIVVDPITTVTTTGACVTTATTATITHTTECQTVCETETETTCETSTETSETCTTTCDTSVESSTSSTTTCDTTVESTTITSCETSVSTSETTATICETSISTSETCETTCLTSEITETSCQTVTVTHTTECETVCETSTATEDTTTTTCTTSVSTDEICTTICETSISTSETCTTTCDTSVVTSEKTTTVCETTVITDTVCETTYLTSEITETICETTTITHTTECITTCETSVETSETTSTTCETSVLTSETCETTCDTTVESSTSSTTTCDTETEVETETITATTCETTCLTSEITETSCATITVTHTTECETTCETSTETSETTTTTCETSVSTSETCTTTCDTSVESSTSSTTTCDTSVYSSTSSTTVCDTSVISSTSTSCITTTITHTTECSTTCETLTETECETTCETSTITSESCITTCETSVETSVSSTTTCTSSTDTSVSSSTTTTCDTITSVDTTCTTSCLTTTSVTTTCTTSCETDEIVETVCETEEETETITETICTTSCITTTGCETTCLTVTSVTTSCTTTCETSEFTTSITTTVTTGAITTTTVVQTVAYDGCVLDEFDDDLLVAWYNNTQRDAGGWVEVMVAPSHGQIWSENMLVDLNATLIVRFRYNLTMPGGVGAWAIMQFSQDNSTWVDSGGIAQWEAMSDGDNSVILTGLNWAGNFYYRIWMQKNAGSVSPTLDLVQVCYSTIPAGVGGWNFITIIAMVLTMFGALVVLRAKRW